MCFFICAALAACMTRDFKRNVLVLAYSDFKACFPLAAVFGATVLPVS
jgi:hypothetical protein